MGEVWEVEVSCPDAGVAREIGRAAVEARLAACANVGGPVESVYRWEGRIVEEPEAMLRLKTRGALFAALADFIAARHPYAVPAILGLRVAATTRAYAEWVEAETRDGAERGQARDP
jgi:periplasmic divalent cation tolerance protein